jgi:hypothetical protein
MQDFRRFFVRNVIDFCVRVYGNADNLVRRFGRYGSADSAGQHG